MRSKLNLAYVLSELGERDEAGSLVRDALADCRRELSPDHPLTLQADAVMAEWLETGGRFKEAMDHRRRVLEGGPPRVPP